MQKDRYFIFVKVLPKCSWEVLYVISINNLWDMPEYANENQERTLGKTNWA